MTLSIKAEVTEVIRSTPYYAEKGSQTACSKLISSDLYHPNTLLHTSKKHLRQNSPNISHEQISAGLLKTSAVLRDNYSPVLLAIKWLHLFINRNNMPYNRCYSGTIVLECGMEANSMRFKNSKWLSIVRSRWNNAFNKNASDNTSSIVLRCFRAEQLCSWHLLHRQLTFDPGFITHVCALNLALCPGSLKDMLQRVCLILLLFDNPSSQRMAEYFRAPVWKSFEHADWIVTCPNGSSSSRFPPLTT